MKVEFHYEVVATVDEDKGVLVEKALLEAAKGFDRKATTDETEAVEIEADDESDKEND